MSGFKRLGLFVVAATLVVIGSEIGERYAVPGIHSVIPSADARVGRPLTPVSVAGVTRRTARRCAAGVYNC